MKFFIYLRLKEELRWKRSELMRILSSREANLLQSETKWEPDTFSNFSTGDTILSKLVVKT